MRISKHLHSCLLVEDNGITALIDPGIFTFQEKALDINKISGLDYIAITHEHADHMHIPLIRDLLVKFPNTQIITNDSIVNILNKENIKSTNKGNDHIQLEIFPHEKLWDIDAPQNVLLNVFSRLTHPGDSMHMDKTLDILALPITAPWGSTTESINKALMLKPKIIIPIHDWMWKDDVRKGMYARLEGFFAKNSIEFKGLETGDIIEV